MRLGLISDVHGNVVALRAALSALAHHRVTRVVHAGDLVGWGPDPDAVVDVVRTEGIDGVAGNHDLMALGSLTVPSSAPVVVQRSERWTREAISAATRRHLAALPRVLDLGEVVVAHGSLDDPSRYVHRPQQAEAELRRLAERHPAATTLVLGHTHVPWLYAPPDPQAPHGARRLPRPLPLRDGPRLVNPGSVGQSRQHELRPRVRCAVLDLGAQQVEFLALRYDVRAALIAARAVGLSYRSIHYPPRTLRRAASRVRRQLSLGRRP